VAKATPLRGIDLVLVDLDGVVYQGSQPIAYAKESLNKASMVAKLAFVTNNASRTPSSVAAHLRGLGIAATPDDVVTSPQAALRLLSRLIAPGSLVLVVGGQGLSDEVEKAGFRLTRSAEDQPDAVVQGFSPDVGWEQLAQASFALQRADIPWIATNTDWTIPVEGGVAPGNGALVSAVHLAVGRLATFAGKPEKEMFDLALERFTPGSGALMIGDRLDTDILGARRAGIASALVLTGIDSPKTLVASDASMRPDFILEDLRGLHQPYPEVKSSVDSDGIVTVAVGKAVVRRKENVVRVAREGTRIDLLRAGSAIIHDSGLKIFGLDVDPQIYS
jgi:glycerol-1-phosphatase|tara:strand:- start:4481 stop:5482 length:1002 start_codon:yes stop_codon:yes gene_type:complete